jgi:hypothetical protein
MTPAVFVTPAAPARGQSSGSDPDLWLYRDRTVGLLKRYLRYSVEVGACRPCWDGSSFARGSLRITPGRSKMR